MSSFSIIECTECATTKNRLLPFKKVLFKFFYSNIAGTAHQRSRSCFSVQINELAAIFLQRLLIEYWLCALFSILAFSVQLKFKAIKLELFSDLIKYIYIHQSISTSNYKIHVKTSTTRYNLI